MIALRIRCSYLNRKLARNQNETQIQNENDIAAAERG